MKKISIFSWMTLWAAAIFTSPLAWGQTVLHTEPSQYSPVVVYDNLGERCMTFGSVQALGRQTCYSMDDPKRMVFNYTRMMMASLFVQPDPKRILVIGLGGGTLPMALADVLPNARIDSVELDPAVVNVATRFFRYQPSARQTVTQMDGRAFVEQAVREGRKYDLVMLDAFDITYIPQHLMTREFLLAIKSLLSPNGVLAANTFSSSDLYRQESATYSDVFGSYFNLRANNRVIFAVNGRLPEAPTVRARAETWRAAFQPYNIDIENILGLFTVQADPADQALVLRDSALKK